MTQPIQTATVNVQPLKLAEGVDTAPGGVTLIAYQLPVLGLLSYAPDRVPSVVRLRFDPATVRTAATAGVAGDRSHFDPERVAAGEAAAAAGNFRPLSEAMDDLRSRHR